MSESETAETVLLHMQGDSGEWEGAAWFEMRPHLYFTVRLTGVSADAVRRGVAAFEAVLAAGRTTLWRVASEVTSHKDFEHDKMVHLGYMRLSFDNKPGERKFPLKHEDGAVFLMRPKP